MDLRELECFLVLSEELHFGRTAERLYLTQSRISQLIRSLERRLGAKLVERTSRRVRLTPLGQRFRAELGPAHARLHEVVERARAQARGIEVRLRIGFQGAVDDQLTAAIATFERRHQQARVDVAEVPLGDPFGPLRRQEVDAAVVLLPADEQELVVGTVFPTQRLTVALGRAHPLADRSKLTAEELVDCRLFGVEGPAPEYWLRARNPSHTPDGVELEYAGTVRTVHEGLTLVAANRGAMLLCQQSAYYHYRESIRFVPVTGLPGSNLGLVWSRHGETEGTRAFAEVLAETLYGPNHGSS